MDKIILRAWDAEEGKMYYDLSSLDISVSLTQGAVVVGKKNRSFTPSLCTGHSDKNGKKVYFGDVVEVDGMRAIIDYDSLRCALRFQTLSEEFWGSRWAAHDLSRFNVIGNIYEDSHLLDLLNK